MIGKHFRPWGELDWIIPRLPEIKWDMIGCLSTEDRFDAAYSLLAKKKMLNNTLFFKIHDPQSKDTPVIDAKLITNAARVPTVTIQDHKLLEPYKEIVESTNRFIANSNGNIIVDISTFPKRFFFPIIKLLINSKVENLLITYSTPEKYCKDELSANPQNWDHLPLFMPVDFPDNPIDVAIVGVGFMPFALPELLLSRYNATPVKFLFPFPPGPPNYQRTWEFMRKIEKSFAFKTSDGVIRLAANNMPDAFDYINQETHNNTKKPLFAPYGPKPISLAMCIYATLVDAPVYYTQPTHYSPEYSTGVNNIFAYAITLKKQKLFSIG